MNDKSPTMIEHVSVWRLVGINGAAFGHEISACVAYTYVPPLLLKAGFSETSMAVIMGIGQLTIYFHPLNLVHLKLISFKFNEAKLERERRASVLTSFNSLTSSLRHSSTR